LVDLLGELEAEVLTGEGSCFGFLSESAFSAVPPSASTLRFRPRFPFSVAGVSPFWDLGLEVGVSVVAAGVSGLASVLVTTGLGVSGLVTCFLFDLGCAGASCFLGVVLTGVSVALPVLPELPRRTLLLDSGESPALKASGALERLREGRFVVSPQYFPHSPVS